MPSSSATRLLQATLAVLACVLIATPATPRAEALTAADVFDPLVLQRIDLQMHSADWAKLQQDFQSNDYYPADFVWKGETTYNIGIRSRGRGSRNPHKPGLRVDFNRYSDGQKFAGLSSLVLDNLTQDASGVHETVTMRFFERVGIAAPLETHVKLYVNNEYIGLYGLIESVDKGLLKRVFGVIGDDTQNDGWLYEFHYQDTWLFTDLGTRLDGIKLRFEAKTHDSKSDEQKYRPVQELITLINQTPEDRYNDVIGPIFDLPGFVRFVAAQAFVGETDGFLGAYGVNNFYLYRLENSSKHVLIAWDDDNAFWGPAFPVKPPEDNVLMGKLMRIPEYNALWYSELARDTQLAEQDNWLDTEIIRQVQTIDDAMKTDANKPFSNNSYEGDAGDMLSFAHDRIAYVKCALAQGDRPCGG